MTHAQTNLNPFEQWMVKSNLQTISEGKQSRDEIVATLKANGYPRIAVAVANALKPVVGT